MAINNPYKSYQNNSVTTASPGELTLMLYNGCIKFIHQAKQALEDKNYHEKILIFKKRKALFKSSWLR